MSTAPSHGGVPVVGRDRELRRISDALDGARNGRGTTLTFIGEPGSGKTALLAAARDLAADFAVLRCRGVDWEAELPFSGLQELLGPALEHLDALPEAQADALGGALGLTHAGPAPALTVYGAAVGLLRVAHPAQPLLLIVDDLHWLDEPTARTLAFASRRLADDAVVVLIAGRPGALLPGIDAAPHLLGPLDHDAVRSLAATHLGFTPPDGDVASLAAASGGNPLAVVETARAELGLRRTALDGPLPVGELIERRFADRLAELPESTMSTLELVAASISDDTGALFAALDRLGTGRDALLDAERDGLLQLDGTRATFTHPLLRSLVYRRTEPERRRRYHAALAATELLPEDLRAWHAACAATEANEPTAARLAACAERFLARSGRLAAAQALARAADLTPEPGDRADRRLRAAQCAHFAGRAAWAEELLELAAADAPAGSTGALWVEFEQLCIGMHLHGAQLAGERYHDLARRAEPVDRELAVLALLQGLTEDLLGGWTRRARVAGELLRELVAEPSTAPALARGARASWNLFVCFDGTADEQADSARDAVALVGELLAEADGLADGASVVPLVYTLLHLDELRLAERLLRAAGEVAATVGDEFLRGAYQLIDGLRLLRIGDWDAAAVALDGARIALRTGGHAGQLVPVEAAELWLAAARGADGVAERFARLREPARRYGYGMFDEWEGASLGLLALGRGEIDAAVRWLEQARDWPSEPPAWPQPHDSGWPADLLEAYVLAGRAEDAATLIGQVEGLAVAGGGRPWMRGAAAFGQAMLEEDPARFEALGRAAIEQFEAADDPFYAARARFVLARRLRRARRVIDAKAELEIVRQQFAALGAAPWVAQVDVELGAAAPIGGGPDALTAQERQIAELVAGGASNKAVAAQLYLSPKTIEAHLSRAYRKLGVSSRTQLAARWAEFDES
jgi:DNA-binding CsgD family transcriptional regulator